MFCFHQETFSFYLMFSVSMIVVSSILTCYSILAIPFTQQPLEKSYMVYIAFICLLSANSINFHNVTEHCNQGEVEFTIH